MSDEETEDMLSGIMKGVSKKLAESKEAFILEKGTIMLEDNMLSQKLSLRLREIKEAREHDYTEISVKLLNFKRDCLEEGAGEFYAGIEYASRKLDTVLQEVLLEDD